MQLYEISRCGCDTHPLHKRLYAHGVTRYLDFNKVENDRESRVKTSQMEPKMACCED